MSINLNPQININLENDKQLEKPIESNKTQNESNLCSNLLNDLNQKDSKFSKSKNLILNIDNDCNSAKEANEYFKNAISYENNNENDIKLPTLADRKFLINSDNLLDLNKINFEEFDYFKAEKALKKIASPENITVNNILSPNDSDSKNLNLGNINAIKNQYNSVNESIKEEISHNNWLEKEKNKENNIFKFDTKKEIFSDIQPNIQVNNDLDSLKYEKPINKNNEYSDLNNKIKNNLIQNNLKVYGKDLMGSDQSEKNCLYLSNEFINNSFNVNDSKLYSTDKVQKINLNSNLENSNLCNYNNLNYNKENKTDNEFVKNFQNQSNEQNYITKNSEEKASKSFTKIKRRNKSNINNKIIKSNDYDIRNKKDIDNKLDKSKLLLENEKEENNKLTSKLEADDKGNLFNNSILKMNSFGRQKSLSFSKPCIRNDSFVKKIKINQSNSLIEINNISNNNISLLERSNSFISNNYNNGNLEANSNNLNNNNHQNRKLSKNRKNIRKKSTLIEKNSNSNIESNKNYGKNLITNQLNKEQYPDYLVDYNNNNNNLSSSNKNYLFEDNLQRENNYLNRNIDNFEYNNYIKDQNINLSPDSFKTTLNNLKDIYRILSKRKFNRSKAELKYLIKFLTSNFKFFKNLEAKKEANNHIKLQACAAALNIQFLSQYEKVFNCGETANSFYIVLSGRVRVIKPKMTEKEMSFKSFVEYLFNIKHKEKDEIKLDRVQQANLKNINLNHIKRYNYDVSKFANDNFIKKYIIEEPVTVAFIKEGMEFGEIALSYDCKRTATIQADCYSAVAFIERNEFNKAYYEFQEKDFTTKILEFKNTYYPFKELRRGLVYKLLNLVETLNVSVDDIIYEQNMQSDSIYISVDGVFEVITCVSLQGYKSFLDYVSTQKNSLLNAMIKNKILLESEFEEMIKNSDKIYGSPPSSFDRDNHILSLEARTKMQNPLDIKIKEEVLKNTNYPITVLVKTVDKPEVLGLEEALELKRRFYTVRCISTKGTLYKIDLKTFFNLINKEEVSKNNFREFIIERKKRLFAQVHRSILLKHKNLNKQLEHSYTSIFNRLEKAEKAEKAENFNVSKIEILHKEVTSNKDLIEYFKNEAKNKNFSNEYLSNEDKEKEKEQINKRCLSSNYAKINERNNKENLLDQNRFNKKVNKILAIRNIKSANPYAHNIKKNNNELYFHKQNQRDLSNDKSDCSLINNNNNNKSNISVNKSFNDGTGVSKVFNENKQIENNLNFSNTSYRINKHQMVFDYAKNSENNINQINSNSNSKHKNDLIPKLNKLKDISNDNIKETNQNHSYYDRVFEDGKNKNINRNVSISLDSSCIYNKSCQLDNKNLNNTNNNEASKSLINNPTNIHSNIINQPKSQRIIINKNPNDKLINSKNNDNSKSEKISIANFDNLKNFINNNYENNQLTKSRLVSSQRRISVLNSIKVNNSKAKTNLIENNNNDNSNNSLEQRILKNKILQTKNNIKKLTKQTSRKASLLISNNSNYITNNNNSNNNNNKIINKIPINEIENFNNAINNNNNNNNLIGSHNNDLHSEFKGLNTLNDNITKKTNKKIFKSKSLKKFKINEKSLLSYKEQIFPFAAVSERDYKKSKKEGHNLNLDLKTFHPELFHKSQSAKLNLKNLNVKENAEDEEIKDKNENDISATNQVIDNEFNVSCCKNVIDPTHRFYKDDYFECLNLEETNNNQNKNYITKEIKKSPKVYQTVNSAGKSQNNVNINDSANIINTVKINYFDFNMDYNDISHKNFIYKINKTSKNSINKNDNIKYNNTQAYFSSSESMTNNKSPKEKELNSNKSADKSIKSPKNLICQSDNDVFIGSHVDLFDDLNKQIEVQCNPKGEKTRICFNFSGFSKQNKGLNSCSSKSFKNNKNWSVFNIIKSNTKYRSKNLFKSKKNNNFNKANELIKQRNISNNLIENDNYEKEKNFDDANYLSSNHIKSLSNNLTKLKLISPQNNFFEENLNNKELNNYDFDSKNINNTDQLTINQIDQLKFNMPYPAKLNMFSNRSNNSYIDLPLQNEINEEVNYQAAVNEKEFSIEKNIFQQEKKGKENEINEEEKEVIETKGQKKETEKSEDENRPNSINNKIQKENFIKKTHLSNQDSNTALFNIDIINNINNKDNLDLDNANLNSELNTEAVKYVDTNEKPFIPIFQFDSRKYSEQIKKKSFSEIRHEITKLTGKQLHPKVNIYAKKIYSEQLANQLMQINAYRTDEYDIVDKFHNKNISGLNKIHNLKNIASNDPRKNMNDKEFELNKSRNVNNSIYNNKHNKNGDTSNNRSIIKIDHNSNAMKQSNEKAQICPKDIDYRKLLKEIKCKSKSKVVFNNKSSLNFKGLKDNKNNLQSSIDISKNSVKANNNIDDNNENYIHEDGKSEVSIYNLKNACMLDNNFSTQKIQFTQRDLHKDAKENELGFNSKLNDKIQKNNKKHFLSSYEKDVEKISKSKLKYSHQKNISNINNCIAQNVNNFSEFIPNANSINCKVNSKKKSSMSVKYSSKSFKNMAEKFNKKLNNNDSIAMAEKLNNMPNSELNNNAVKSDLFNEQQSFSESKYLLEPKNLVSQHNSIPQLAKRAVSNYGFRTKKIHLDENSKLENFNKIQNFETNKDANCFDCINLVNSDKEKTDHNNNLINQAYSNRVVLSVNGENKLNYTSNLIDNKKNFINNLNNNNNQNAFNHDINSDASKINQNESVNNFFQNKNSKFIDKRKAKISVKVQMKYFKMLKKEK